MDKHNKPINKKTKKSEESEKKNHSKEKSNDLCNKLVECRISKVEPSKATNFGFISEIKTYNMSLFCDHFNP